MGKRLGCCLSRPRLIPDVDCNCSGGYKNSQGRLQACLKAEKPDKRKIYLGHVSEDQAMLFASEVVILSLQISDLEGL